MIRYLLAIIVGLTMSINGSSIIDYEKNPEKNIEKIFQIVYLKHSNVGAITPFLKGICEDCHWVTDQILQRIGVLVSQDEWREIKLAIQRLDRKEPIVQLSVDVIEISDIQSDKYQNMLYELSAPINLAKDTSFNFDIEYMISSGNALVVSSPRVMTKSGEVASIAVGDRVPYTTVIQNSTSTIKTIEYVDSGINLKITPHVHYNNNIDLLIELNYKTVSGYRIEEGNELPIIATRSTKLTIQVPNGITILFAGLLDQTNHEIIEKVPILGDIPLIGMLFTKSKSERRSTDLIYKVTPTIIR